MEKKISYLNRDFNDYKNSILNYTKQYYPELEKEFNDASIGSWLIDIVSNVGDNLSFHIDRVYQETNIESAKERSSIYALARNNGVKIPGPKASIAEVTFSCELPVSNSKQSSSEMKSPDWSYAPVIKKGTKVGAGNQIFELIYDVDFNEQFNENGISNRIIIPKRNSNGFITKYIIKKTGIVSAGETKIFTKVIRNSDIKPFMSIVIPDNNVMNVESIIFKDGTNYTNTPTMQEFLVNKEENRIRNKNGECVNLLRFFEVDYLAQQYLWGDDTYKPRSYDNETNINGVNTKNHYITKGAWLPLTQKFITEFTDKGYLRVIFGAGKTTDNNENYENPNLTEVIINNDGLGVLPNPNTTMYIMYRKGGGSSSNVAKGSITNILFYNIQLRGNEQSEVNDVKRSITVTNEAPSVSGRDMPSIDEVKYLIKYSNGAQERCVTVKDYADRISKMPARYGSPFRYGVTEENNKIMIYTIGLDANGKLTDILPYVLKENIQNYLSEYKMINDYIEIKSGRIINLQFEVDLFIDKNYNTSDVLTNVITCIKDYMKINKLQMGDDIFVGDIEKEISKIDGVLNLIDLRVYNIYDDTKGYSSTRITQKIKTDNECAYPNNPEATENTEEIGRDCIDLYYSDKMLYTENDTMFEIKYPEKDIICRAKTR